MFSQGHVPQLKKFIHVYVLITYICLPHEKLCIYVRTCIFGYTLHLQKEREVERVLRNNGLLYDVPITKVETKPLMQFPWLRPRDFLYTMYSHNDLHHVLGGCSSLKQAEPVLQAFWTRYQKIYPEFQLFQQIDRGEKKKEQCIPLYLHGDEGTWYKRGGVFVFSFQSPLGYGTSKRDYDMSMNLKNLGESGLPLNFLKAGMYTRMLMLVCPKDWYLQNGVLFCCYVEISGIFCMYMSYMIDFPPAWLSTKKGGNFYRGKFLMMIKPC